MAETDLYSGLSALNGVTNFTFRPVCQTIKGVKYFEFVDSATRKPIYLCECGSPDTDLIVRDHSGTTCFCIRGALEKDHQVDVYITSDTPIGQVKGGIVHNASISPLYRLKGTEGTWSCGPPIFLAFTVKENHCIAEIMPKQGEISIEMIGSLPVTDKSLLLAVATQLAFTRYGYMRIQLPYLFGEFPDGSKMSKEQMNTAPFAMKQVQNTSTDNGTAAMYQQMGTLDQVSDIFITPSGRNSVGREYYDVRRQDNKIILTFERNKAAKEIVAKNIYGEVSFIILSDLKDSTNELRTADGRRIGTIGSNGDVFDENGQLLFQYHAASKDFNAYPLFSVVKASDHQNEIATINYNGMFVNLSMDGNADSNWKNILVSLSMKLAVKFFQIDNDIVRNVSYMYKNKNKSVPIAEVQPKAMYGAKAVVGEPLTPLKELLNIRVRGAGYNRQGIYFYEIIDTASDRIKMTIECLPKEGQSQIKDKRGRAHIQISGLWDGVTDMFVRRNDGYLLGIIHENTFLDRNEKSFFIVKKEALSSEDMKNAPFNVVLAGDSETIKATITPEISSIHIRMDGDLSIGGKALLIAFAMRLFVKVYQLDQIPIPLVNYNYVKELALPMQKVPPPRPQQNMAPLVSSVGESDHAEFSQRQQTKPVVVQIVVDKGEPKDAHSQAISRATHLSVPPPVSVPKNPSPILDPFPTLQLFNGVVNIGIRPVGEDKKHVRYFKIVNLDKNRSFLTCESSSPCQDLCFKQRYGEPQFYIKGAFLEKQTMQVYVNPFVAIGDVENILISNEKGKIMFYVTKPITLCGPPSYKVIHIASNNLMARIFNINSEIVINVNHVCTSQQKALILSFAMNKAFTVYNYGKIPMNKVNYQYVKPKGKVEEQQPSRNGPGDAHSGQNAITIDVPVATKPHGEPKNTIGTVEFVTKSQSPATTGNGQKNRDGEQPRNLVKANTKPNDPALTSKAAPLPLIPMQNEITKLPTAKVTVDDNVIMVSDNTPVSNGKPGSSSESMGRNQADAGIKLQDGASDMKKYSMNRGESMVSQKTVDSAFLELQEVRTDHRISVTKEGKLIAPKKSPKKA